MSPAPSPAVVAAGRRGERPRLAVVVSHPIQYFSPWFRAVAADDRIDLRVLYCSRRGLDDYLDPAFGRRIAWDVPLLDGFDHEFLDERGAPDEPRPWRNDNPGVAARLDAFDPDAVLVFGYARRANWRAVRWARRRRRVVLLYSDSNAGHHVARLRSAGKRLVVGTFYRHVTAALYNSENNRRYHARYGGRRLRLYPCRLPVDVARLTSTDSADGRRVRESAGLPPQAFVAVFCGKLSPRKRVGDLIEAVHRCSGDPEVWALVVGDGAERDRLEARAVELGNRAVFAGFVNQSRIGAHYAAADVFVLPSAGEPHGLAVTEATAFGLPVVVSDQVGCVGPTDVARPGENALVVPCGDVAALAAALDRLRSDPHRAADMGRASLAVASTQDVATASALLVDAVLDLVAVRQVGS